MKKNLLIILGLSLVVFFTSCDNDDVTTEDYSTEFTIAEDEAFNLKSTDAIDDEIESALFEDLGFEDVGINSLKGANGCAVVTKSGPGFPKEITIDFGEDCVGRNGMSRSGTIIITLSDSMINEGATKTVTFVNVMVGERKISKTATIINLGQNEEGNWVFSRESVKTMVHSDGTTTTRTMKGEKEWISGFGTREIDDNVFYRTGEGTITIDETIVLERKITKPLLVDRNCGFIIEGSIEISKDDQLLTIDFGDGECDAVAVVTKDGESEEIDLDQCRFREGKMGKGQRTRKGKSW